MKGGDKSELVSKCFFQMRIGNKCLLFLKRGVFYVCESNEVNP